jgi:Flp pilus assembly protein TadG
MSKSVSARQGRTPSRAGSVLRCRRGIVALEFALVGAIFFISVFTAIEVGRYLVTLEGLRNYKADAMRQGIVSLAPGQTLCRGALATAMGRGGVVLGLVTSDPGVCVTRTEATVNAVRVVTIRVTVDVTHNFVGNFFGFSSQRIQDDVTFSFQI